MSLIYISPYYSMLDYTLALEGVAGFRHYDRYGNDEAIYVGYASYSPAIVGIGDATNTINFVTKIATVDGVSISGNYSGDMGVFPSTMGGDIATDIKLAGTSYDLIDSGLAVQPVAINFPVLSDGTNVVNNYSWVGSYDITLASATLTPGWVEGNQLVSTGILRNITYYQSLDIDNISRVSDPLSPLPKIIPEPTPDDSFSSVTILMHMEGTEGSSTFINEKTLSPIATNGHYISTQFSRFGTSSGRFSPSTYSRYTQNAANTPTTAGMIAGNQIYTYESWLYLPTRTSVSLMSDIKTDTSYFGHYWDIGIDGNGKFFFSRRDVSTANNMTGNAIIPVGIWTHIAVVQNLTQFRFYVNGVLDVTASSGGSPGGGDGTAFTMGGYGGVAPDASNVWYQDEIRLTMGVARYTGNTYTLPQATFSHTNLLWGTYIEDGTTAKEANSKMGYYLYDSSLARATTVPSFAPANELGASGGVSPTLNLSEQEADSNNIRQLYVPTKTAPSITYSGTLFDDKVVALFHFDELDGSTTFTDTIGTTAVSTYGSPRISTSLSKFGGSSAYFNGASSIKISHASNFNFGDGDFTVEFWANPSNSYTGAPLCYGDYGTGSTAPTAYGFYVDFYNARISLRVQQPDSGTTVVIDGPVFSPNIWYNVAITRRTGTIYFYVNGVRWGSMVYNYQLNDYFRIGSGDYPYGGTSRDPSYFFTGYIDEVRITKGFARYTDISYNIQTSPFDQTPATVSYIEFPTAHDAVTDTENIGWYNVSTTIYAQYSPMPFNLAIAQTGLNLQVSEDDVDITNITQLYISTLSSVKTYNKSNLFEGATLNNGRLTTDTGGGWRHYYCTKDSVSPAGIHYFEFVSGGGHVMYGFIGASITTPHNGQNYMWNGGRSYPGGTLSVSGNTTQEWIYYINQNETPTAGWVYGCSYNYNSGEMKFYRNNTLVMTCYGQAGVAVKPAISTAQSACSLRFNHTTWSYNPEGINPVAEGVSGFATEVENAGVTIESGVDISTIEGNTTGYGVSTPQSISSNVINGYIQKTIIGDITHRDRSIDEKAQALVTQTYPADQSEPYWSYHTVWGSSTLDGIVDRNPKVDQDSTNLIWNAQSTTTISDYWGQHPAPSKTFVGDTTYTHFSHTTDFIEEDIARTYTETTQLECKGAFEQVATVNTSEYLVYWDYEFETTLYPLMIINTSGLSNTTNASTV